MGGRSVALIAVLASAASFAVAAATGIASDRSSTRFRAIGASRSYFWITDAAGISIKYKVVRSP
jgi:hypothetical protein